MGYLSLMRTTLAELGNHVVFAQDEFIGSFWFFALMVVILLALCGVFYYLRTKQSDD